MITRIYTPILNSLLFFLLVYLAYSKYGIDKLIPYLMFSILTTLALLILGLVKKLGRSYIFISALPLLTTLITLLLLFTGIGWWILMLFGFHGPTPN
ncbi:hypothetical protein QSV08_20685 [Maribacter sp. BPC-D8]|uniref:hypothetical protein n=1 Tax=Maribacter sp. BPC-D8 TaxID=3053613 RepID=UPI002B477BC4|nr:hypothetical protein [Maribacter sp. BPC-D8]WRI29616.1 hypothetical protein QSV08_20685 [Maribacter sp. BPC-D8]